MPVYRVKEKYWWWDPAYQILDAQGNSVYTLHRKAFAMDQAIEMKEEQLNEEEGEEQAKETVTVLTIRKKVFSMGHEYQVVRNDNVVVASIKSKKMQWFGQERHVFELADVEYVVDETKWNTKSFSIQPTKGKDQLALVYKKNRLMDMSGSFWVDVKVDPRYYEGEALKDMCGTVLAACIIMIEILTEQDRQFVKLQQQQEGLTKRIEQEQKRKANPHVK